MARLSDVPVVLRRVGWLGFARRVWNEVGEDNLFAWAAAVAYSWLFAVFPFMIFLMSLLSFLSADDRLAASAEVRDFLRVTLSDRAADTIWNNVQEITDKPRRGLLGIGLLLTLWGASGGINMTITALERCYEIDRGRPFYKKRPVALALTLVVATLVISLVLLVPVGSMMVGYLKANGYSSAHAWLFWAGRILRYPLAVLLMFTVLNVVYHYGPSIRQRFQFVTPGAVFAVVVWWLMAFAFRFYVERYGKYNETYGTVGGVAILLLFFYIDAAVLLVGAEINSEIDFEITGVPRGSQDFTRRADAGAAAERTPGVHEPGT